MSFWDSVYSADDSYFGDKPSILAKESLLFFRDRRCRSILELGCGQGRDAIFFARNGLKVHAIDFSGISVAQLRWSVVTLGMEQMVTVSQVDLSKDLPWLERGEAVDAVYSNLFYCMPFDDKQLQRIFAFVHDALPEGGVHVFSIRNKNDESFGKGREVTKDTFEINGFRVRFFAEEEILGFSRGFKTLLVKEAFEEPCALTLVFTIRVIDPPAD